MFRDETLDKVKTVRVFDILPAALRDGYKGTPDKFKIRCPLHNEKTPSFHVTGNKWRCFGACAKGGDTIELYKLLNNGCDFVKGSGGVSPSSVKYAIVKRTRHNQHKIQEAYNV